jgi:hypothetical protein
MPAHPGIPPIQIRLDLFIRTIGHINDCPLLTAMRS